MSSPGPLQICLLFTPELCRTDPWQTLARALAAGLDLVQWRRKARDPQGLTLCLARCAEHGVPVIVNDFVDLACATAAAGAHVGQEDMPASEARRLLGSKLLGVSTHDLPQLAAAAAAGADYVGFGPCFPTTTKGYATALPHGALAAALAAARIPLYAIGGITPANVGQVRALGCTRIAVSAAVLQAADPAAAVHALRT